MMMTDYNDGKWHGWNGGECPVAPNTMVNVAYYYGTTCIYDTIWGAGKLSWSHLEMGGDIVAFRVIREPRDFWLIGHAARDTEAEAIAYRDDLAVVFPDDAHRNLPITRVREVL